MFKAALGSLLLALAAPAMAQYSTMSMGIYNDESSFRPDLSARDIKVIERVLGLGDAEKQAVEDLYAGFAAALRNEGGAIRDFVNGEIEKSQAMQNVKMLDKARAKVTEWEKHSEEMKKSFLGDLKSLLSREQEARWPIVERELRRLKTIGNGRLAGESLDLNRLAEDALGEPPTGELAELLNRYCEEIDHALKSREDFLSARHKEFSDAETSDPQAALKIWNEAQRIRGGVRDINDRYARLIAEKLPGTKASTFKNQCFDQSYRALVAPTRADEYLKDAGELQTMTESQRSQFNAIKAKYDSDRRALLARGAAAWRQYQEEDKPERLAVALGERPKEDNQFTGSWLPDTHPLVRYRLERLKLDQDLRASLDAILKPEQRTAIPGRNTPYAQFQEWGPAGL
jgi:hypothetical protein